ncbi:TAM domain methyltransferase [Apiospora sp. TS-2023a]
MSDSDDDASSTSPDPQMLVTKELPPPPTTNSQDADTEAGDGAVITGAESFWPSVDTDDSDTPPEDRPGTPRKRKKPKATFKAGSFLKAMASRLGRTFDDRYQILPNDQAEQERNKLQHNMFREVFQGKIHLAPIRDPKAVLDLGAAPGTWALEFGKLPKFPRVLGVDLEPIPPQPEALNCRFQIMNIITDVWEFPTPFDFIHLRMLGELLPSGTIGSIYDTLSPGGWLEISEWVQVLQCPNHSLEGTSFAKWDRAYQQGSLTALSKLGNAATFPYRYKSILHKAGFRRIHVRKYAVPTNAWANSKSLQRIGHMQATNFLSVVDILSRDMFVHVLGWTSQEADALIAQVRHEVQENNLHAFYTLLTVYAQKPP